MPVYPKGPGKWRVVVSLRGQRKDWVLEGTKADGKAFEARKRAELEAGATSLDVRVVPTLRDFTGESGPYLQHTQEILAPATSRNRGYQIASLVEILGDMRLNDIDRQAVAAYQSVRRRAGVRPSTVNDDVKVLIAILNFARERKLPVGKPSFQSLPERGKRRNAEPWSSEEVARLLDVCGNGNGKPPPDRYKGDVALLPVLVFLLNTGCRRGEAISLEWENVDFARGKVRIWASEEWQPKDDDNREVPLNDVLRSWLERLRENSSCKWVFPARGWKRFAYWPQRRFDLARTAAGLTGGPHRCRHTYASHFLAACPDLFLLARILGHSHQRVTELYGHLLPDSLSRAAAAVSFAPGMGPAEAESKRRWRG